MKSILQIDSSLEKNGEKKKKNITFMKKNLIWRKLAERVDKTCFYKKLKDMLRSLCYIKHVLNFHVKYTVQNTKKNSREYNGRLQKHPQDILVFLSNYYDTLYSNGLLMRIQY